METIATLEKDGVLSKAISMPEHLGTHIDAPNHFEKNQPDVSQIPPEQLFGPGIVIDVAPKAEQDADYMASLDDVRAWEKRHSRVPDGAIVLLYTGWGRHWSNYERYKNQDIRGKLHFPGYSPEAARFLVSERKVRGLGIDTLSIDRGTSTDFAVHHIVNAAGKYGLENVAHLEGLPPRGFWLMIAPIKVETGSGGPTRIFAVLPKREEGGIAQTRGGRIEDGRSRIVESGSRSSILHPLSSDSSCPPLFTPSTAPNCRRSPCRTASGTT